MSKENDLQFGGRFQPDRTSERLVSLPRGLRRKSWLSLMVFFVVVAAMAPSIGAAGGYGHGPGMPAPTAVFKDADGNAIGQLVGFWSVGTLISPLALLNFDGDLALVEVGPKNLRSLEGDGVNFTGPDCTGQPYQYRAWGGAFSDLTKNIVSIVGPDSETGEYRVFKTTSQDTVSVEIASNMNYRGICTTWDQPAVADKRYPSVEIEPNPLADIHGPTAEHPERTLVMEGGTRYGNGPL